MGEPSWAEALTAWSALASALFGAVALVAVFYVGISFVSNERSFTGIWRISISDGTGRFGID